jgi:hypothetical protein
MDQLHQGQYVMALLTTGTAGVMTLIMIGTVAVGSLMVEKVARTRSSKVHAIDRFMFSGSLHLLKATT